MGEQTPRPELAVQVGEALAGYVQPLARTEPPIPAGAVVPVALRQAMAAAES